MKWYSDYTVKGYDSYKELIEAIEEEIGRLHSDYVDHIWKAQQHRGAAKVAPFFALKLAMVNLNIILFAFLLENMRYLFIPNIVSISLSAEQSI